MYHVPLMKTGCLCFLHFEFEDRFNWSQIGSQISIGGSMYLRWGPQAEKLIYVRILLMSHGKVQKI